MTCPPDADPFDPEVIQHDDALPSLVLREQAGYTRRELASVRDPAERKHLARNLARAARRELEILKSREAVAMCEVLAAIETALGAP